MKKLFFAAAALLALASCSQPVQKVAARYVP